MSNLLHIAIYKSWNDALLPTSKEIDMCLVGQYEYRFLGPLFSGANKYCGGLKIDREEYPRGFVRWIATAEQIFQNIDTLIKSNHLKQNPHKELKKFRGWVDKIAREYGYDEVTIVFDFGEFAMDLMSYEESIVCNDPNEMMHKIKESKIL